METGEKEVLLVIADISGYTRFIAANRETLAHSQIIITELMRTVLKELKVPLRVSNVTGRPIIVSRSAALGVLPAGARDGTIDRGRCRRGSSCCRR